jgi:RNA polymerase-binding transcription factor DksA
MKDKTMDTQQIATTLRTRLAELTKEVANIEAVLQAPLDADFAEQANELEDHEALSGIEAVHREEIIEIGAALARIEAGTYGRCRVCGAAIPPARLMAIPTAATCITHATG